MSNPTTIVIDDIKYVREDNLKRIKPIYEGEFQPFEIGAVYLIRTVTMIDVGRVVAASKQYIILEDAAWVADTGRFADALISCKFNETEPFPDGQVILSAGSIIDAVKVNEVIRSQK